MVVVVSRKGGVTWLQLPHCRRYLRQLLPLGGGRKRRLLPVAAPLLLGHCALGHCAHSGPVITALCAQWPSNHCAHVV